MSDHGTVLDVRTRTERVLDRLGRPRTSSRYLPEVDGLRALSIVMVLAFHVFVAVQVARGASAIPLGPFGAARMPLGGPVTERFVKAGGYGVEIFFAISGFILAGPFLSARFAGGRQVSVLRFYGRRLTRLEPPYVIALLFWGVVAASIGGSPSGGTAPHLLAGATYTHLLWFSEENPLLGVAWSLEAEVIFYLLVPIVAAATGMVGVPAMRRLSIVLLGAASLALAGALGAPIASAAWYAPFFLSGWLVADLRMTQPGWGTNSRWWDFVAVFGFVSCIGLFVFGRFQDSLVVGPVTVGLLLAGVLRGTWVRDLLARRLPRTLGAMSYSVYLIHYPAFLLWARWASTHPSWSGGSGVCLAAAATLALCLLFYVTIERPCIDPGWPQKMMEAFARRSRATGQPLASARVTSESST